MQDSTVVDTDEEQQKYDHSPSTANSMHVRFFGFDMSRFSFRTQFIFCVIAIFSFFLPYGFVQESIFRIEGFEFGLYITFVQYVLYAFFSLMEGLISTEEHHSRASFADYLKLSSFQIFALAMSNIATIYLNYPTKVLLKTSKIIPVMLMSRLLFDKRYSWTQYLATFLLLIGVSLFSVADFHVSPNFTLKGIMLMCASLTSESLGSNLVEKTLTKQNSSEREVYLYTSSIGTVVMLILLIATGEFLPAFNFCWEQPHIYVLLFVLSFLGYAGGTVSLNVTRTCGIFITMTVGTCRKLLTMVMSFLLFPKPFDYLYLVAGFLAFGGISLNIYAKNTEEVTQMWTKMKVFIGKRELKKDVN